MLKKIIKQINPIKFITKSIRASIAWKFVMDKSGDKLLDIGCDDGFFIKGFSNLKTYGKDIIYGDDVEDGLDFSNNYFDYITMLAVIEHFIDFNKVIKECKRVLKKGGLLIITTPFKKADKFIRLYSNLGNDHVKYFNLTDFINMKGFILLDYGKDYRRI